MPQQAPRQRGRAALLALLLLPAAAAALGGASSGGAVSLQPEGRAAEAESPASSSMRGAWLVQASATRFCTFGQEPCKAEQIHAMLLLATLITVLVSMICAFAFFREDKEEQITPLCPSLVVLDGDLEFRMPLEESSERLMVTRRADEAVFAKVTLDWPDPFRPGASGVAASVRVNSSKDSNLATVVARNVAMVGQGLALCRTGCEIFGFVEPDGPQRYYVRHRTGVHLLTLVGDFGSSFDIEGVNPVGSRVFWFKKDAEGGRGSVLQHFDAGLALCSILATHVHRRLTLPAPMAALSPEAGGSPAAAAGAQPGAGDEERSQQWPKGAEAAAAQVAALAGSPAVAPTSAFPEAPDAAIPSPREEGAEPSTRPDPGDAQEQPGGTSQGLPEAAQPPPAA